MSYPSPKIERVKDNIIRIYHPEILEPNTYLTAAIAASGTSLTVANNAGFSNTDPQTLILFENLGSANAEIKRVNGAITAGTALTSQGVTFPHAINTPLSRILFNQVEISGASTVAGAKTSIETVNINVQAGWTDYVVTGSTYNYYFARFYNSLVTTPYYGEYSDSVAYTDFPVNTLGFVRRLAFKNVGEEFGGRWDFSWVADQIYLCELDVLREKDKWSQLVELDYDLGNVTVGMARIALPDDIEDKQTNKSILGVRIGTDDNLDFIDRPHFEELMENVATTTLASDINALDVTVTLTDSRDFEDSGSIEIEGTSYSYTANNRSTNVLSGFTAFTDTYSAGDQVWQGTYAGIPTAFTVKDGYIYFDVPPNDDYDGRNIWLDYYKGVTRHDSDGDVLGFNDSGLYVSWLEMAIKKEKANGLLAPTDISLLEFQKRKGMMVAKDRNPVGLKIVPQVPGWRRKKYNTELV